MFALLEILLESGRLDRLLFRGWRCLFSTRYRRERHALWRQKGRLFALLDIALSSFFFAFEVYVVAVIGFKLARALIA